MLGHIDTLKRDVGIGYIYSIGEMVKQADYIDNFLYDRKSGMFFCNINCGYHFKLAQFIMEWGFPIEDEMEMTGCWKDEFITRGMGMILSSAGPAVIFVGKDITLTAQEKLIFKKMNIPINRY